MNLQDAIERIKTGRSLLFCGAGFSVNSVNLLGTHPPSAKDLAHKICNTGGFDEDDDLMYASDYFISKFPIKIPDLIKDLQNNYTIKEVFEDTKKICSHKWRRIYTTNYDNTIEFATNQVGKHINSVTIDDSPRDVYKKESVCVHINGAISNLNESSLNTTFKLSHSSYVSPNSFENSTWYYPFKKDLEQANALVFVGYSLYDIEIEKILFSSRYIDKTIFIIGTDASAKAKFLLGKYGTVEPIGVAAFADELNCFSSIKSVDVPTLKIAKYEINDITKEIDDEGIRKFLFQGVLFSGYIDNFVTGSSIKPFLIKREKIEKIIDLLKSGSHIIIYSEFGNGKTVCLEVIKSILTVSGKNVYYVSDYDTDYSRDIDTLAKTSNDLFLIIDGYSNYMDLLEYIFTLNQSSLHLILADRTTKHMVHGDYLNEYLDYAEINVDLINTDSELNSMINIINNLGFWGDKITWSLDRKKAYLSDNNDSKISSILLSIFDSPQIRSKIEGELIPLLSDDNHKKAVFAICLINIMDLQARESLISEIAMNDLIYDHEFVNKREFKELFIIQNEQIKGKSTIFARSIIQNYFNSSYTVSFLLDIVEKFEKNHNAGNIEHEIFRSLLRFSFIESLLPIQQKRSSLMRYYQDLKIRIRWLDKDPHYWLQYGMSELVFSKLDVAQRYFNNAYELAKSHINYDTSYIDRQQARLYLQSALKESDGKKVYNNFIKAHDLLCNVKINHYSCRQIMSYEEVYKKKYNLFSQDIKEKFINSCSIIKKMIIKAQGNARYPSDDYYFSACLIFLDKIITENIKG